MRVVWIPPANEVVPTFEKLLRSDNRVVDETVREPPKETAEPFRVIWELARLALEIMPAPVSDANEAAPERESDVP